MARIIACGALCVSCRAAADLSLLVVSTKHGSCVKEVLMSPLSLWLHMHDVITKEKAERVWKSQVSDDLSIPMPTQWAAIDCFDRYLASCETSCYFDLGKNALACTLQFQN